MGRRTKDADWLSNWTIVWKWGKVETPSPVDSTDCCLNICRYIGWIDKYLYLSIQPIHLQILRRRCCVIPRCGNKKQLGFCISGRSRKIMVATWFWQIWNMKKFSCSGDEEKGRKKSQADDRPSVHHASREGDVCVNVKKHFKIVRLDSFWIMEIKLQC